MKDIIIDIFKIFIYALFFSYMSNKYGFEAYLLTFFFAIFVICSTYV